MAHWRFWLSPSPHLFFFFVIVVLAFFVMLVMQWNEFVINEPGLPDLTMCTKSLVNQGIPGKSGKPGYSKNQENQT